MIELNLKQLAQSFYVTKFFFVNVILDYLKSIKM